MNLNKIFTFLLIPVLLFGQEIKFEKELPHNLELNKNIQQTYQMTTDYIDYDLLGHFKSKKRITALYTTGLGNNKVKWNDVKIATSDAEDEEYSNWKNSKFMDNFTYVPTADIVSPEFFAEIPEADIQHQNLVWDIFGIEIFAYEYWDSLKLNQVFHASDADGEVDLAGQGTFENKNIQVTWIGVTDINNEKCAIIKYTTMNNPLNIKTDNLTLTGRSHYWGEIYVSLEDKQIEYATLYEDVITDLAMPGLPNNILGYTVRYITLEKTK